MVYLNRPSQNGHVRKENPAYSPDETPQVCIWTLCEADEPESHHAVFVPRKKNKDIAIFPFFQTFFSGQGPGRYGVDRVGAFQTDLETCINGHGPSARAS